MRKTAPIILSLATVLFIIFWFSDNTLFERNKIRPNVKLDSNERAPIPVVNYGPPKAVPPLIIHSVFSGEAPRTPEIISKFANQDDFKMPWLKQYYSVVSGGPVGARLHRKIWELTYIMHIVNTMKLCTSDLQRGYVWAVGQEPLPSYFANLGCRITGSDMPETETSKIEWAATGQHSSNKDGMYHANLISSKETFDRLVDYRAENMNFLPPDIYGKYDFTWSTCSLEHVGSISLGQRFIMNSMDILKPGGLSIHSMEFTLSSLEDTVETGSTVLWRKKRHRIACS